MPTDQPGQRLDGFDGVWLLPGSPYRDEQGAVAAVRTARERGLPFLGTCGGFQHTLLKFARDGPEPHPLVRAFAEATTRVRC